MSEIINEVRRISGAGMSLGATSRTISLRNVHLSRANGGKMDPMQAYGRMSRVCKVLTHETHFERPRGEKRKKKTSK